MQDIQGSNSDITKQVESALELGKPSVVQEMLAKMPFDDISSTLKAAVQANQNAHFYSNDALPLLGISQDSNNDCKSISVYSSAAPAQQAILTARRCESLVPADKNQVVAQEFDQSGNLTKQMSVNALGEKLGLEFRYDSLQRKISQDISIPRIEPNGANYFGHTDFKYYPDGSTMRIYSDSRNVVSIIKEGKNASQDVLKVDSLGKWETSGVGGRGPISQDMQANS